MFENLKFCSFQKEFFQFLLISNQSFSAASKKNRQQNGSAKKLCHFGKGIQPSNHSWHHRTPKPRPWLQSWAWSRYRSSMSYRKLESDPLQTCDPKATCNACRSCLESMSCRSRLSWWKLRGNPGNPVNLSSNCLFNCTCSQNPPPHAEELQFAAGTSGTRPANFPSRNKDQQILKD